MPHTLKQDHRTLNDSAVCLINLKEKDWSLQTKYGTYTCTYTCTVHTNQNTEESWTKFLNLNKM